MLVNKRFIIWQKDFYFFLRDQYGKSRSSRSLGQPIRRDDSLHLARSWIQSKITFIFCLHCTISIYPRGYRITFQYSEYNKQPRSFNVINTPQGLVHMLNCCKHFYSNSRTSRSRLIVIFFFAVGFYLLTQLLKSWKPYPLDQSLSSG